MEQKKPAPEKDAKPTSPVKEISLQIEAKVKQFEKIRRRRCALFFGEIAPYKLMIFLMNCERNIQTPRES